MTSWENTTLARKLALSIIAKQTDEDIANEEGKSLHEEEFFYYVERLVDSVHGGQLTEMELAKLAGAACLRILEQDQFRKVGP